MALTRTRLIVLGVAVALIGGYFLLDWLVVTDEEKLHHLVVTLEKGVARHDAEACVDLADEQSWSWLGSRQELVALVQELFDRYQPEKVIIQREEVDLHAPRATIRLRTFVLLGHGSPFSGPVQSTWTLQCRKHPDGEWYVVRADVELPQGGVRNLRQLVDMARDELGRRLRREHP